MHHINRTSANIRGGFIHIPFLPEQTVDKHEPSLGLETVVEGLRIAAVTSALHEKTFAKPEDRSADTEAASRRLSGIEKAA